MFTSETILLPSSLYLEGFLPENLFFFAEGKHTAEAEQTYQEDRSQKTMSLPL